MIRQLSIDNFKSLVGFRAETRPLTLLYGMNASGKSSFLQALLFLSRAVGGKGGEVPLNDSRLRLGRQRDVFYFYAAEQGATMEMHASGDGPGGISLRCQLSDYDLEVIPSPEVDTGGDASGLARALASLQYVSAARPEPSTFQVYDLSQIGRKEWGRQGENAVAYLFEKGDSIFVDEKMLHDGEKDKAHQSLRMQVNAWLSDVAPGTALVLERKKGDDAVSMKVKFATGPDGYPFRPENVGFGISIVLPLLVMILSAKPGDVLLLENPEAHLHPSGQAHLGELLAKAASVGIQLFVETHSDHVINGVRVAISQRLLPHDKANILFFERKTTDGNEGGGVAEQFSVVRNISFDEYGEMDEYPNGFMDEWNLQLAKLWTRFSMT